MKRFLSLLAVGAVSVAMTTDADAQNRNFGAQRFIMDDGAGNTMTLQTPLVPMGANATYTFPVFAGIFNANVILDQGAQNIDGAKTFLQNVTLNSGGLADLILNETSITRTGNIIINPGVGNLLSTNGSITAPGSAHALGTLTVDANVLTVNGANGPAGPLVEAQINGDLTVTGVVSFGSLTPGEVVYPTALGQLDGEPELFYNETTNSLDVAGTITSGTADQVIIGGAAATADLVANGGDLTLNTPSSFNVNANFNVDAATGNVTSDGTVDAESTGTFGAANLVVLGTSATDHINAAGASVNTPDAVDAEGTGTFGTGNNTVIGAAPGADIEGADGDVNTPQDLDAEGTGTFGSTNMVVLGTSATDHINAAGASVNTPDAIDAEGTITAGATNMVVLGTSATDHINAAGASVNTSDAIDAEGTGTFGAANLVVLGTSATDHINAAGASVNTSDAIDAEGTITAGTANQVIIGGAPATADIVANGGDNTLNTTSSFNVNDNFTVAAATGNTVIDGTTTHNNSVYVQTAATTYPGDGQSVAIRARAPGTSWTGAAALGGATSTVMIGEVAGRAAIGGHTPNLMGWAPLYINEGSFTRVGSAIAPTSTLDVTGSLANTGNAALATTAGSTAQIGNVIGNGAITIGNAGVGAADVTINAPVTGDIVLGGVDNDATPTQMLTLTTPGNEVRVTTLSGTADEGVVFTAGKYRLGGTANTENPFLVSRFVNLNASNLSYTANAGANSPLVITGGANSATDLTATGTGAIDINGTTNVTGNTTINHNAGANTTMIGTGTSTGPVTVGNSTGVLTLNSGNAMMFNVAGVNSGRVGVVPGNTALGYSSLSSVTTGNDNSAFGHEALSDATNADLNSAFGAGALQNSTTGGWNVAVGGRALETQSFNNGGVAWTSANVAVGVSALLNNQPTSTTTGVRNTAVGTFSLESNTIGVDNAVLGYNAGQAGTAITTGGQNTLIGSGAQVNNAAAQNRTALGYNAVAAADNSVQLGNNSVTLVNTTGNVTTTGGATITGTALINASGAGATTIGNAAGGDVTIAVDDNTTNLALNGIIADAAPTQFLTLTAGGLVRTTTLSGTADEGVSWDGVNGQYELGDVNNTGVPFTVDRFINLAGNNLSITNSTPATFVDFDGATSTTTINGTTNIDGTTTINDGVSAFNTNIGTAGNTGAIAIGSATSTGASVNGGTTATLTSANTTTVSATAVGTGDVAISATDAVTINGASITSTATAANSMVGATANLESTTGNVTINADGGLTDVDVTGDMLPTTDDVYDLGSLAERWRDVHVGPASLNIHAKATDGGYTAANSWAQGINPGAGGELTINANGAGNELMLTPAGALTTAAGITATTGNINATGGTLQTNGVTRIAYNGDATLQATTTTTLDASGTARFRASSATGATPTILLEPTAMNNPDYLNIMFSDADPGTADMELRYYDNGDAGIRVMNAGGTGSLQVGTSAAINFRVNAATGLITGVGGATISGAAINLNASSNFPTNINTGTSTGTVTIGSGTAGVQISTAANGFAVSSTGGAGSGLDIATNGDITNAGGVQGTGLFTTSGNITTTGTGTITAANGLTVSANGATITGNSTMNGNLDMTDDLITNIGAAGTDFTAGGGLNIATALDVNGATTLDGATTLGDGADVITINATAAPDAVLSEVGLTTNTAAPTTFTISNSDAGNVANLTVEGTGTFGALALTGDLDMNSNDIVEVATMEFGAPGNNVILTAVTPVADRTYTLPDVGAAASFVMTEGIQTANGAKTFTGNLDATAGLDVTNALLTSGAGATITGTLTANDGVILGSSNADALTVNAAADFNDVANVDGAFTTTAASSLGNDAADVITVLGATTINGGASTAATSINGGTGAGAVTIGNTATATMDLTAVDVDIAGVTDVTGATTVNVTGTGATTIGHTGVGAGNVAINTAALGNITLAGPTNINVTGNGGTTIGHNTSTGNIALVTNAGVISATGATSINTTGAQSTNIGNTSSSVTIGGNTAINTTTDDGTSIGNAAATVTLTGSSINHVGPVALSATSPLVLNGASGTANQVLISQGAGTVPAWTSTLTGVTIPFTNISSGTNTTAAMVVGAGATLGFSTTGTIDASSLDGNTWEIPEPIGVTTPNTAAFTTLTTNGTVNLNTAGTAAVNIGNTTGNTSVTGHVLPSVDDVYDLGSLGNRWRDVYVGPASLNIASKLTDAGYTAATSWAQGIAPGAGGELTINAAGGASELTLTPAGALTTAAGLTVSSGGAGITGNSTVTGTLGVTGTGTFQTKGGSSILIEPTTMVANEYSNIVFSDIDNATADMELRYYDNADASIRVMNAAGTGSFQVGTASAVHFRVDASTALTTIGSTPQAGALSITDGTSNTGTFLTAALSLDRTYTLPNVDGTILTTANGVELQAATPGTQQTGHMNISGTAIIGGGATITGTTGINSAAAGTTNIGFLAGTNNINGTTLINDAVNNNTSINTGASTGTVNIASGTGANTVNIGNPAATTVTVLGPISLNVNNTTGDATSINTGSSTGDVFIGNSTAAQANSVTILNGATGAINIGNAATGNVTIGNAAGNVAIADANWSITGPGVITTSGVGNSVGSNANAIQLTVDGAATAPTAAGLVAADFDLTVDGDVSANVVEPTHVAGSTVGTVAAAPSTYAGRVTFDGAATTATILYTGVKANSAIIVTYVDPAAGGAVPAYVTNITANTSFTVTMVGTPPAGASISYIVINP